MVVKVPEFKTLEEAKQFLRDNFENGATCPCCTQYVKLYKRKLTSGMAVALIRLYRLSKRQTNKYIHITKLGHLNGGEFAQLERWGLIRQDDNTDEKKKNSGMWSITLDGCLFVEGFKEVPSHAMTYDGKTIKFTNKKINIRAALGSKFDYKELMSK